MIGLSTPEGVDCGWWFVEGLRSETVLVQMGLCVGWLAGFAV